jgi:hypothetical protein
VRNVLFNLRLGLRIIIFQALDINNRRQLREYCAVNCAVHGWQFVSEHTEQSPRNFAIALLPRSISSAAILLLQLLYSSSIACCGKHPAEFVVLTNCYYVHCSLVSQCLCGLWALWFHTATYCNKRGAGSNEDIITQHVQKTYWSKTMVP